MRLVILFPLKSIETLENGLQPHSGATSLFSMRTELQVSSHSCHSVDADAWRKWALRVNILQKTIVLLHQVLVQYQGLRKVMILSLILSWKSYLICTPEEVKSHMSAHMSKMFKSSCENLTEEQAIIFENLLTDFQNIFGRNDTELGCFVVKVAEFPKLA